MAKFMNSANLNFSIKRALAYLSSPKPNLFLFRLHHQHSKLTLKPFAQSPFSKAFSTTSPYLKLSFPRQLGIRNGIMANSYTQYEPIVLQSLSSSARQLSTNSVLENSSANPNKRKQQSEQEIEQEPLVSPEHNATSSDPNAKPPSNMKLLFTKYGRIAIFSYLLISAIDLPIIFATIYFSGDTAVNWIIDVIGNYFPSLVGAGADATAEGAATGIGSLFSPKTTVVFIAAYAIHKLIVPIRLGLTAYISPFVLRKAQQYGWKWLLPK